MTENAGAVFQRKPGRASSHNKRRNIMSSNKLIGFVLLAVGILLLVMGYNASQSVGSQFKEAFSGSMSDKATLFYIGGAVVTAVGAYLAFMSRK
jgi:uncharacterized membrane protein YidH (DUF202 family)